MNKRKSFVFLLACILIAANLLYYSFAGKTQTTKNSKMSYTLSQTSAGERIRFSSGIMYYNFPEADPCNFWELWNASNANGWNVVEKNRDSTQFTFFCRLQGNESSWFVDAGKQVIFANNVLSAQSQAWWKLKTGAHLRLGTLIDANKKTTRNGVSLYDGDTKYYCDLISAEASSEIKLYSCYITRAYSGIKATVISLLSSSVTGHIYNTFFTSISMGAGFRVDTNIEFYNLQVCDLPPAYAALMSPKNAQVVRIEGCAGSAIESTCWGSYTMKDFVIRNTNYLYSAYYSRDVYFIDFDTNTWKFQWFGISNGKFYRQYSFGVNVTDIYGTPIENANVTVSHYGENAGQDFTVLTGSNGSFATKTLTMGFYNQTGGDTIYNYNPYNITITKSDYQTRTFNWTLNEKKDWTVVLESEKPTGA